MKLSTRLKLIALRYNNFFTRNPLVLNIELTHACNLNCRFCGRVQGKTKGRVSLRAAKEAINHTKAPIIYFTGGEPFLLPKDLQNLTDHAIKKGKIVIIVTNGILLDKALPRFNINNKKNLVIMFSADGMKSANDKIRGKGSFGKMEKGIRKAKELGFRHLWINHTIYKDNIQELKKMIPYFSNTIEYFHLNIYFDFSGKTSKINNLNRIADYAIQLKKARKVFNPYLYFNAWKGKDLDCTPGGTVTLDPKGWRSPCYFIETTHFRTYKELMKNTDWKRYEKKKDPECRNCISHCGFEPTIYGNKFLLLKEIWSTLWNSQG